MESAAIGLLAGRFAAAERLGLEVAAPPQTTAHGALLEHITGGAEASTFQPMNVNFGLFPPLPAPIGRRKLGKRERKPAYAARARADLAAWIAGQRQAAK